MVQIHEYDPGAKLGGVIVTTDAGMQVLFPFLAIDMPGASASFADEKLDDGFVDQTFYCSRDNDHPLALQISEEGQLCRRLRLCSRYNCVGQCNSAVEQFLNVSKSTSNAHLGPFLARL